MKNGWYIGCSLIGFVLCMVLIWVFDSAGFLNILTGLFALYVLWALMGAGALIQIEVDKDKEKRENK